MGAGAIGQLWAVKLLAAGCNVTLIKRRKPNPASCAICFYASPTSIHKKNYLIAAADVKMLLEQQQPILNLLIATKSFDVVDAFNNIKGLITNNTQILALCNGLGIQENLASAVFKQQPSAQLYWGVSSDGALLEKNLTQTGHGNTFIGSIKHNEAQKTHTINTLLLPQSLSLSISYVNSIQPYIWQKFFINCAINPVTVKFNCSNGELITNTTYNIFFQQLCVELQTIYDTLLLNDAFEFNNNETLNTTLNKDFDIYASAEAIALQTAKNNSSMLQDYRRSKPTEIASLNAYLILLTEKYSISCPLNRQLISQIEAD